MLRVFVALGKQLPKNKAIIEDTIEVGRLLAKYGCTMVQGGARTGLMGTVVSEFQKYSDEVVMIVPEVHKADLEGTVNKEHYIVEGEADRLKITINTCDLIVVLPGGTGTLAELAYYNETCKSGEHNAKIVMLNTKGFYNKLFNFIKHQTKLGFMKKEDFKFDVINNTKQLELIIQQLLTVKQSSQVEVVPQAEKDKKEESTTVKDKKSTKASSKTTKSSNSKPSAVKSKQEKKSATEAKDVKLEDKAEKIIELKDRKSSNTTSAKSKASNSTSKQTAKTQAKAKASVKTAKQEEKVEAKVETPSKPSAKKATSKISTPSKEKAKTASTKVVAENKSKSKAPATKVVETKEKAKTVATKTSTASNKAKKSAVKTASSKTSAKSKK